MELEILSAELLKSYCELVNESQLKKYLQLEDSELSIEDFSFYTSVSAVFSSKIEGEEIDLDSYVKHKRFGIEFLPDYTRKIDDLYNAYQFAKLSSCNPENIKLVHKKLTANILSEAKQGKLRTGNMFVTTSEGRIEYVAASPFALKDELYKLFKDLAVLIKTELTLQEVYYYASYLHLAFVKIHPFDDGNGRTARLLEKWFLAEKLGEKAWLLQSEKNYYQNHDNYYKNIRALGLEYESLNYSNALPFLLMLPHSV